MKEIQIKNLLNLWFSKFYQQNMKLKILYSLKLIPKMKKAFWIFYTVKWFSIWKERILRQKDTIKHEDFIIKTHNSWKIKFKKLIFTEWRSLCLFSKNNKILKTVSQTKSTLDLLKKSFASQIQNTNENILWQKFQSFR